MHHPSTPRVTLYWRPACGFCALLRRDLERSGLDYLEVNIWDEPEAAAVVRRVAAGSETVPTVLIGDPDDDESVGLVNPTLADVLDAIGVEPR